MLLDSPRVPHLDRLALEHALRRVAGEEVAEWALLDLLLMEREHFVVNLRNASGEEIGGAFCLEEGEDGGCQLTLEFAGETLVATESDYFEALVRLRQSLWAKGFVPLCYGASKNVYPSGMGRDMGSGLKAYRMQLGRHARQRDLVFIFDTCADIEPASPEDQRAFFESWLQTPRA